MHITTHPLPGITRTRQSTASRSTRRLRLHTTAATQAVPARAGSWATARWSWELSGAPAAGRLSTMPCTSPFGLQGFRRFKHKEPGSAVIAQIALYAPPSSSSITLPRYRVFSVGGFDILVVQPSKNMQRDQGFHSSLRWCFMLSPIYLLTLDMSGNAASLTLRLATRVRLMKPYCYVSRPSLGC